MSYCAAIPLLSPEKKLLHGIYHDTAYGFPIDDDNELFCRLVLEINQAGLSWETILKKEVTFRKAYSNFDIKTVTRYTQKDRDRLMQDSGVIRNRLKIEGTIANAKAFIAVREEFGTFDKYIWNFVKNRPIDNKTKSHKDLKAKTELSDLISADLRRRGFKFVGSTIVYAHMQATGMINDHLVSCYRHKEVRNHEKK